MTAFLIGLWAVAMILCYPRLVPKIPQSDRILRRERDEQIERAFDAKLQEFRAEYREASELQRAYRLAKMRGEQPCPNSFRNRYLRHPEGKIDTQSYTDDVIHADKCRIAQKRPVSMKS